ncbi:uncharacterized protein OE_5315R (plasmid) [Halobacterium salinarum R1]|uniref:Uncharacterized protein n=1 Tax=Halobacterium salinarum (strain ATCC 29341 / DSM 671 / R1) TaxID=478009 RepID=B0RA30_HALS3|nr:uncharacterized protein OE_5315R [Halobacterium salinarum R1]
MPAEVAIWMLSELQSFAPTGCSGTYPTSPLVSLPSCYGLVRSAGGYSSNLIIANVDLFYIVASLSLYCTPAGVGLTCGGGPKTTRSCESGDQRPIQGVCVHGSVSASAVSGRPH